MEMNNVMPDMAILEQANDAHEQQQRSLAESQKQIQELVEKVWQAKITADKAEQEFKELKQQLTNIMDLAGVEKIQGKHCTVSCTQKESVSVPKEIISKKKLFDYISTKYGDETLLSLLTINARSFSSWHEKEKEVYVANDEKFPLENIVKPYTRISLGIRKRTKK